MSRKTGICFFLCILLCISFVGCGESVQPQNPDIATELPDTASDSATDTNKEPDLQEDERDGCEVSFDVVPQICNDIMEKLISRGWNNVTVTHGSIETRSWGIWVDTTYGAEESHIYTIFCDSEESSEESDFHAVSSVIFDEDLHDWVELPIIYIMSGGRVIDEDYLVQGGGVEPYCSYEYTNLPEEYLYADDSFFDWYLCDY